MTATMNIARNTRDIPINGIFANKSMRAMRPTSIDRMTVIPVNTFRRCRGGEMELGAARVLNTLLHDRAVAVAPDEHPWDGGHHGVGGHR